MQETNVPNLIINNLTKEQYEGIETPSNTELYLVPDEESGNVLRDVGEVVYSFLPLTNAGLHLLDGALIQGGGIYQGFVDYIAELYGDGTNIPSYFCTETQWQTSVTQYGVCGKFVYDSTNNTVRLPKVTGILEGTTDVSALGDLVEAGLPNITGQVGVMKYTNSGAFRYNSTMNGIEWDSGSNAGQADFDASRSSSIYGNSSTVQPQTIKAFYYIVIATSTKTEIQVDIDEIATDLNGKADTDLTNTTDQAKILMGGMAMPSDKYIGLTLGASGSKYTAPANGWFLFAKTPSANGQIAYLQGRTVVGGFYGIANTGYQLSLPVKKGDTVTVAYSLAGATNLFRFIYAEGSESEAQ